MTIKSVKEIKHELRKISKLSICELLDSLTNNEDGDDVYTDVLAAPTTNTGIQELHPLVEALKHVLTSKVEGKPVGVEEFSVIGIEYFNIFNHYWFYSPIIEKELNRSAQEYHDRQFPDPYPD